MLIRYLRLINLEFIIFIFVILTPIFSFAAVPPPNEVYRADFRAPDEIFRDGFSAWGDNMDLFSHVLGDSGQDRTDAFVSTTSSWQTIEAISLDLLENEDRVLYLYTLRPSNTFYDVNGSLLNENMRYPGTTRSRQALTIYTDYCWEEEFASAGGIPADQIIYAERAYRVDSPMGYRVYIDPTRLYNPSYIDGVSAINSGYMNATRDVDDMDVLTLGELTLNPVQGSFDVSGCIDPGHYHDNESLPLRCHEYKFNDLVNMATMKIAVIDNL